MCLHLAEVNQVTLVGRHIDGDKPESKRERNGTGSSRCWEEGMKRALESKMWVLARGVLYRREQLADCSVSLLLSTLIEKEQ